MSDKEHYAIEYTLAGEHHVDVIENLDVPIIDVVHELAQKHHVVLDDDVQSFIAVDEATAHASGITDVSIHSIEQEDLQLDTRNVG
ncbi:MULTISPECIES: hypothetical protein [Pseudomonas]|jgi:hypothetical protein|uniref:Uncharacterized protein n=1 Tax=Pseudomonas folii TaxID=2762593 RepID=A0ABR7B6S6_9PSED|nr:MULTISPECIES: hypothetical protein [Pseudomonas]MBC3952871.1 hypothetical protein [Pseudomonas folii]RYF44963.1 MAG: hypothetical protein EOO38_16865 [Cytophagaceae bacterium]